MARKKRLRRKMFAPTLPNPVAVAALEGMLDAMMKPVAGLSPTAVGGLRGVFAMLLGTAAEKGIVLEVEGRDPVTIRKEDVHAVAIRGLADLTRAEVTHMLENRPSGIRLTTDRDQTGRDGD
jgi:hypothetical protein